MAYINVDLDFLEHPKTKRFVAAMGEGSEIYILRLWIHTAKFYSKDGAWTGHTTKQIESILGWRGKTGQLLRAMAGAGLIESKRGGNGTRTVLTSSWDQHQGHIAKMRERSQKAAYARWNRINAGCSSNAQAMLEASPSNALTIPTMLTSLTDSSASTEEQKRKDVLERKANAANNDALIPKLTRLTGE